MAVLLGRMVLFLAIAFGVSALVNWVLDVQRARAVAHQHATTSAKVGSCARAPPAHSTGFSHSHEASRVRIVRPKDPIRVLLARSAVRSGLENGSAHMKEYESSSVLRKLPVDHIEEVEEESHVGHLQKSLGLWQLTAIGVGGIIGVGIFSLAGLVAHGDQDNPGVGPSVLIAFLIAGLASAAAACPTPSSPA